MRIYRLRYAIGPGYISKSVKEDGKRKRVEEKIEWCGKIHVRRYSLFFFFSNDASGECDNNLPFFYMVFYKFLLTARCIFNLLFSIKKSVKVFESNFPSTIFFHLSPTLRFS